jgi:hypothetical protein
MYGDIKNPQREHIYPFINWGWLNKTSDTKDLEGGLPLVNARSVYVRASNHRRTVMEWA